MTKSKEELKGLPEDKLVSITEAARINKVTRQAIYVAIKLNKLKARKETTRWTIHLDDLEAYRNQKYSRTKSVFNGELLFDNDRGFFSVNQDGGYAKSAESKNLLRYACGSFKSTTQRCRLGHSF